MLPKAHVHNCIQQQAGRVMCAGALPSTNPFNQSPISTFDQYLGWQSCTAGKQPQCLKLTFQPRQGMVQGMEHVCYTVVGCAGGSCTLCVSCTEPCCPGTAATAAASCSCHGGTSTTARFGFGAAGNSTRCTRKTKQERQCLSVMVNALA